MGLEKAVCCGPRLSHESDKKFILNNPAAIRQLKFDLRSLKHIESGVQFQRFSIAGLPQQAIDSQKDLAEAQPIEIPVFRGEIREKSDLDSINDFPIESSLQEAAPL